MMATYVLWPFEKVYSAKKEEKERMPAKKVYSFAFSFFAQKASEKQYIIQ